MIDAALHGAATWLEIGLAIVTLVPLLFLSAPYGRHARSGWGPTLPNRWGWILMESPTLAIFLPLYWLGPHRFEVVPLVFLLLWLSHYLHRTLMFPFRLRDRGKTMPVLVVVLGMVFNCLNAFVIAPQLSSFGIVDIGWLTDPRFIVGTLVFCCGYVVNRAADRVLIRLRAPGQTGYQIPRGPLFRHVSCPNYLGEIAQWFGFALATWSLPGLAFALYTTANLGPRALTHHRDYRHRFPDYPPERRALIPYVL